jgi:uncharacterized protein YciI
MYVLSLNYIVGLDAVDRVRAEHLDWIVEQYAAGRFVVSGPKAPRTGGVILARAMPRDELDDVIASDPFTREGVASYDVLEFTATTTAAGFESLGEREGR